jgi:hypothetical protein
MPALLVEGAKLIVPPDGGGQLDATVQANFERFDGLNLDFEEPRTPTTYGTGDNPRPGQSVPTPLTYTPGPLSGLTNALGAMPLPVHDWLYKLGPGDYTPAHTPQTMQSRLGVGQANGGVAQTVALADITYNPPIPESLQSILAAGG